MRSMLDTKEGWQAEGAYGTRVYHYIRETMALCRGLGFYRGDLVPDVPTAPRGNHDCAKCFRILRGKQQAAKAAKQAATPAEPGEGEKR